MVMVILVIFIILLFIILVNTKENFVPYNFTLHDYPNVKQPDLPVQNINKPEELNYKIYLDKSFYWNTQFTTFLSNLGINVLRDTLYNIMYKDTNNVRHFLFNVDTIDSKTETGHKLKILLRVNNMNKYLDDTGEYNGVIKLLPSDIELEYVDTILPSEFNAEPNGSHNQYYYTLNRLYLLDPFPTSGKYMKIDQNSYKPREPESQLPRYDFQCPFHRANKNYPNNFGKVLEDKCEFPLNIKPSGFNEYSLDPQFSPYCYNCIENKIGQGTLGMCCEDQKNKELYPTLTSPDYAFPNDKALREKYKDTFLSKNLQTT